MLLVKQGRRFFTQVFLFKNVNKFKFQYKYFNHSFSTLIIDDNNNNNNNNQIEEEKEEKEKEEEEEEIHPYWKALESRVVKRKLQTVGKTGRSEVRKSDEDFWLEAGVYEDNKNINNNK